MLPGHPVPKFHHHRPVPIINHVQNVRPVPGDAIGVPPTRHVMPWDHCMDVLPGRIVMPFIDVNDWNRNPWREREDYFPKNPSRA